MEHENGARWNGSGAENLIADRASPDWDGGDFCADYLQLVVDVWGSYYALRLMKRWLRGRADDGLDGGDRAGLAVMLEGLEIRLEQAVDSLHVVGDEIGVAGVRDVLRAGVSEPV